MNLKELWNSDEISISLTLEDPSKNAKEHKSIDIIKTFENQITWMYKLNSILGFCLIIIYVIFKLYWLSVVLTVILVISNYFNYCFIKRFKQNRFILNLKDYLKETASLLSNYIKYSLYGLIVAIFVIIPSLYVIGINSYLDTGSLFSLEIFKQKPGLLVGLAVSCIITIIISLSILYKVYLTTLKKVNIAIQELE